MPQKTILYDKQIKSHKYVQVTVNKDKIKILTDSDYRVSQKLISPERKAGIHKNIKRIIEK